MCDTCYAKDTLLHAPCIQPKTNIFRVHFSHPIFHGLSIIAYTSLDFGHRTHYGVGKRVMHKPY